jgi:hypothetical protein
VALAQAGDDRGGPLAGGKAALGLGPQRRQA